MIFEAYLVGDSKPQCSTFMSACLDIPHQDGGRATGKSTRQTPDSIGFDPNGTGETGRSVLKQS